MRLQLVDSVMELCLVDRIIRPKVDPGVDWGSRRVVLVQLLYKGKPVKELWWQYGSTHWGGRGKPQRYSPAHLVLVGVGTHLHAKDWIEGTDCTRSTIQEGGKLSRKLISTNAEIIDNFFRWPVAKLINLRKTLVLEPESE